MFDLDLEPRGAIDLVVDIEVSEQGDGALPALVPRPPYEDGTRVSSDDQLFNRILRRSLDDLELLHSDLDGQSYYAAGVPWFATLFGRDSIITALQTLSFVPGIAEGTLRLLASRLGREYDDERDEEPGKVLHELRVGEPAALGETPFARYYGSVDATPLFLCLLGQHADWSGNLDLFRELRAPAEAALEWIDRYGDLDGDGLVEYLRRSPNGLVTQGWKDSADGVPDDVGRAAPGAGRAGRGAGLRDPREAADGQAVRARRRGRARRAAARRGRRRSRRGSSASGSPTPAATRSGSTATSGRAPGSPRTRAICSGPGVVTRRARPLHPRRPDGRRHVHRAGV